MLTFASESERKEVLDYLADRFGIPPETFDGFCLLRKGNSVWMVSDAPDLRKALGLLNIETAGIPLLRKRPPRWKPTTAGVQFLGPQATRNVIDLDEDSISPFLEGQTLYGEFDVDPGYVIIRSEGRILGCGFYDRGKLRSQVPKEWRQQMKPTEGGRQKAEGRNSN